MHRRLRISLTLLFLLLWSGSAAAAESVPPGFRIESRNHVAPGVELLEMSGKDPSQVVHVARVASDAPVSFRPVLSNEAVFGPEPRKERTSSMCIRVNCLVAVNADFSVIETGEPLGGLAISGELVRSPNASHHQLTIGRDGSMAAGPMKWSGVLMPSDLRPLEISGVNVARRENQIILYTPLYGASTATNSHGVEILARVPHPGQRLVVDQTSRIELIELREGVGDALLGSGGLVLSGHGAGAEHLRDLWKRIQSGDLGNQALVRLETEPVAEHSVGGTPILLKEGRKWFADEPTSLFRDRHPRTAVGWNSEGVVWLVTVDGRQPGYSEGMTLTELANFLLALGPTEAINLDGGGSTTFVARGEVLNRPSDRAVRRGGSEMIVQSPRKGDRVIGNVERPRPVALALVFAAQTDKASPRPIAEMELPGTPIDLPIPAADPGSNLAVALPAITHRPRAAPLPELALLAFAFAVAALVLRRKYGNSAQS